ncbi:uncharacterized protein C9orf85 homolog [Cimex lectularius]|uniref:Uncharacterized protein n=1 Tax=Cimex lectularius TaxID=79782 RepID=A0A8I6RRM0_CIMLE|nr:uncharacterized protein C9orf85 homolog [Cimex lectularius]
MSTEKGNVSRKRPQKHQNSRKFKNDLHDKTPTTKFLNSIEISDVCPRCKSVLEWKIKYKKYKLLKNPSTCTKCSQRNVTLSYRIMCAGCAEMHGVCPKCGVPGGQSDPLPSDTINDNTD